MAKTTRDELGDLSLLRKPWTDGNRFAQWLLQRALVAHLRSPRATRVGPAHTSFAGWLYFRVLCGIKT